MKLRLLLGCVVVLAVVATHSFALAAQDKRLLGDRFSLTIGWKTWVAKWQTFNASAAGDVTQETSDTTVMQGPTVTAAVKIRNSEFFHTAFANFTWLQGGFSFDPAFTPNPLRRDYSVTAGLAVYKGLGVFAGYYHNMQRFDDAFWYSGPIIGIAGSVQASKRIGVFGNIAYAILDFQQTKTASVPDGGLTDSVQGYSTDVGVNISGPDLWRIGTAFQVGVRAQVLHARFGSGNNLFQNRKLNDITWGPMFTVLAKF